MRPSEAIAQREREKHVHSPTPGSIHYCEHRHENGENPHSHPIDAQGRVDTHYGGTFFQSAVGQYYSGPSRASEKLDMWTLPPFDEVVLTEVREWR